MKSLLTVALAGLLGLQTLGFGVFLMPPECEKSCPTDGPDGSCAPFCLDCVCCPTMRSFVQPEPAGPPPAPATQATPPEARISNPSPRAADIFHVPRPSLIL